MKRLIKRWIQKLMIFEQLEEELEGSLLMNGRLNENNFGNRFTCNFSPNSQLKLVFRKIKM